MIEQVEPDGSGRLKALGSEKGRVLVIDDDPDILDIISTLLQHEGYRVFRAAESNECFSLLNKERPHVALIDFMMPDLNGLEMMKIINRIDGDLQLIAITGVGSERLAVEFMKAGAVDYLSKPFETNELLAAVRKAFEARRVKSSQIYQDLATANRELLKSASEKRAILRSMADGLFTVDTRLRILSWNPAVETITGRRADEVIGRSMEEIFGIDFCREEKAFLKNPGEENFFQVETEIAGIGRDETTLTLLKSTSLLRDGGSEVIGLVLSLKDITAGKSLIQERIEREREMARVQEELRYQDAIARKNKILEKQMVELNRKVSEAAALNETARVLTSKLDLKDVLDTVMNMAGELFTAKACSIRLLKEETGDLQLAASYGLSEEYKVLGSVSVGESVAGVAFEEGNLIHIADVSKDSRFSKAEAILKEGLKSFISLPLTIRGRGVGVLTVYHPKAYHYNPDEIQFLATFAGIVSIAVENARLYEEKVRLAISDGLTGLYNHKHFHEEMEKEIGRARRYDYPLSVIMVDIDYFKSYNDSHGHLAGDALLRRLSDILGKGTRENDLLARYGGEEFIYLLPQTDKREALAFARRLRRRVARKAFDGESVMPEGKLTISLGVASFPQDEQDSRKIIHAADTALYEAKKRGRNQVRAFRILGK